MFIARDVSERTFWRNPPVTRYLMWATTDEERRMKEYFASQYQEEE